MKTVWYEKRLRKGLFRLSILTLVTVIVWIAVVVYQMLTKSQVEPDVKKAIAPLTPVINLDTMEKLKQRQSTPAINWDSLSSAETSPPAATAGADYVQE